MCGPESSITNRNEQTNTNTQTAVDTTKIATPTPEYVVEVSEIEGMPECEELVNQ
jgi:hypothetical protein